ncbi:hypothetical protein [Agromyces subbeticus]|uniref:hypothetical protein n=1 Tax=Agromyces subbeticus TaxID=293890 RepID=UPI0003B51208|nr:hypothetical protein [Agromyces subbeticus]
MAHEEVQFGRHYTGVLHDQVKGSIVPATLIFTERRGAQVEVAFMSQSAFGDFPAQRAWFDHNRIAIPANLNFYSTELRLGLYNTSLVKVEPRAYVTMGTFTAAEVVFQDRDVPVSDPLLVTELQSRIDGLADLTGLRASDMETATDDDGRIQALHITVKSPPLVTLLSHRTLTEHVAPLSRSDPWAKLIAFGRQLTPADFSAWNDALNPTWTRAFASFLDLMSRDKHPISDRLVNIGIAVEMAGRLLPVHPNEAWSYRGGTQRTFNTYAYRCVMELGADWSSIADSPNGVAAAIRWAYTSSKHPEDEPPSQREQYLISLIMMTMMRLVAISRANPAGEMISSYVADWQFRQLGESTFKQARVRISNEGRFYSTDEAV